MSAKNGFRWWLSELCGHDRRFFIDACLPFCFIVQNLLLNTMNYAKKTGFNIYESRHCAYITYSVKTWFLKNLSVYKTNLDISVLLIDLLGLSYNSSVSARSRQCTMEEIQGYYLKCTEL